MAKKSTKAAPKKTAVKSNPVSKMGPTTANDAAPFLPPAVTLFFKNISWRGLGLLLIVMAGGLLAALITHNPADPSVNMVTSGQVSNALGPIGADISDVLISTLGIMSYGLIIPLLFWGYKIIRLKWLPRFWFNLLMLPGAMMLLAAFAATPKLIAASKAGGVVGGILFAYGDSLLATALSMMGVGFSVPAWVVGALYLSIGLPLFCMTFGLSSDEWAWIRATLKAWIVAVLTAIRDGMSRVAWAIADRVEERRERAAAAAALDGGAWDNADELGSIPEEYNDGAEGHKASGAPKSVAPVKAEKPVKPPKAERESALSTLLGKKRVQKKEKPKKGKREEKEAQASMDLGDSKGFILPSLNLLEKVPTDLMDNRLSEDALEANARMLEGVLDDFGVQGEIVNVRPGPVVTLYELEPAPGTKSSRVIGLADDIARSMSARSARVAVVPGRNAIGIELPNINRETVYLRELLASKDYENTKANLPMALGKDIGGASVVADLATMPHLLVAGTTGAGKSVGINTMILSLIYRHTPEKLRFIMVDPKMLELSIYEGIPHLLTPVVTEAKKAVVALKWAVREMEDRYKNMSKLGVRNIAAYNKRILEAKANGEALTREIQTGFDKETGQPIYEEQEFDFEPLPFIVVVIDEMADLMLVAGKDVESTVQRLAQMARAAGIHVIMATQRPSVDVITGTIKANFPTRISFMVTSKIDSRTILSEQGAEQLLGRGDMLFMAGGGRVVRVHGGFVSDEDVEDIVKHVKTQGAPDYLSSVTEDPEEGVDGEYTPGADSADNANASLYDKAVALLDANRDKASISYIQRRLGIGYNKAANLVEQLEEQGVISAPNSKGRREVLLPDHNEF